RRAGRLRRALTSHVEPGQCPLQRFAVRRPRYGGASLIGEHPGVAVVLVGNGDGAAADAQQECVLAETLAVRRDELVVEFEVDELTRQAGLLLRFARRGLPDWLALLGLAGDGVKA